MCRKLSNSRSGYERPHQTIIGIWRLYSAVHQKLRSPMPAALSSANMQRLCWAQKSGLCRLCWCLHGSRLGSSLHWSEGKLPHAWIMLKSAALQRRTQSRRCPVASGQGSIFIAEPSWKPSTRRIGLDCFVSRLHTVMQEDCRRFQCCHNLGLRQQMHCGACLTLPY